MENINKTHLLFILDCDRRMKKYEVKKNKSEVDRTELLFFKYNSKSWNHSKLSDCRMKHKKRERISDCVMTHGHLWLKSDHVWPKKYKHYRLSSLSISWEKIIKLKYKYFQLTFGVNKKYCALSHSEVTLTSNSNILRSLMGSMPWFISSTHLWNRKWVIQALC